MIDMSLDVELRESNGIVVYSANITHNLTGMASYAGIYWYLWRPDECGIKYAHELIAPLIIGIKILEDHQCRAEKYTPQNGWGSYEMLLEFTREYLRHCILWPYALIEVSR